MTRLSHLSSVLDDSCWWAHHEHQTWWMWMNASWNMTSMKRPAIGCWRSGPAKMLWKFGWMSNPELWLNEDHSGRERGQSKMMWSSVAGTWHERQTVVAPGRGGRNSLFVPIDQMRETTFVNGKERSTNHVPGHQAGWLMAGAPLDLVKASVKSLTEHQANGRSAAGEGSKAQLHLLSKGPKLNSTGLLGGAKRRLQMIAGPST